MNPQLQAAIADILKALLEAAKQVGQISQEQLPLLVREYLRWSFCSALIYALVGIGLATGALYVARRFRAYPYKADSSTSSYSDDAEARFVGRIIFGTFIFPTIACVLVLAVSLPSCLTMVQIWLAPRVFLLESIAALAK